jgi:hypothetical protein
MKSIARVHRHGDRVAVSVGKGPTTYLTHEQADVLAEALSGAARNVRNWKFANSPISTMQVDGEEAPANLRLERTECGTAIA